MSTENKKGISFMYKQNGGVKQLIDDLLLERRSNIKSSELAKVLGKQHRVVLRDIREELEREDLGNLNVREMFVLSEEPNSRNQWHPFYFINPDGLLHLMCRYGRYNYKIRQDMIEIHRVLYLLYRKY
jgi:hypothetical protein